MLVPMAVNLFYGEDWSTFAISCVLCLFVGGAFAISHYYPSAVFSSQFSRKSGFLIVTSAWLAAAITATVPFVFSGFSLADATFEAVSGITTTGSSIVADPAQLPKGLLIWRALLQWYGGIGFILTAVMFLPALKVGGMQLFSLESTGNQQEKAMPLIGKIASTTALIYLILTACCVLALMASGIAPFEAFAHAFTTVSTGGFSTSADSIAGFNNPTAELVIIAFMVLGSLPFLLYLRLSFSNDQVIWFLSILVAGWVLLFIHSGDYTLEAARTIAFNATSLMTGTGYTTFNVSMWGGLAVTILFCLMLMGGCSGSTTCGIKIFRIQALWTCCAMHVRRLLHPRIIRIPQIAGKELTDEVANAVLVFFVLFIFALFSLSLFLSWQGLDFATALAAAATAIANVGPVLGNSITATEHLGSLNDASKWAMSLGMLAGRLEFYALLVLFIPAFWRD